VKPSPAFSIAVSIIGNPDTFFHPVVNADAWEAAKEEQGQPITTARKRRIGQAQHLIDRVQINSTAVHANTQAPVASNIPSGSALSGPAECDFVEELCSGDEDNSRADQLKSAVRQPLARAPIQQPGENGPPLSRGPNILPHFDPVGLAVTSVRYDDLDQLLVHRSLSSLFHVQNGREQICRLYGEVRHVAEIESNTTIRANPDDNANSCTNVDGGEDAIQDQRPATVARGTSVSPSRRRNDQAISNDVNGICARVHARAVALGKTRPDPLILKEAAIGHRVLP
jgi:hypothetical protein